MVKEWLGKHILASTPIILCSNALFRHVTFHQTEKLFLLDYKKKNA